MTAPTTEPLNVQIVCWGNICRSPMGHVVLTQRLAEAGLADQVTVTSSGISNEEHGGPIDPRARTALQGAGYTVHDHRAHQVRRGEVGAQDLVLAMTTRHEDALLRHAQEDGVQVIRAENSGSHVPGPDVVEIRMWREFDPQVPAEPAHRSELDAPDPWYGGAEDFAETLSTVERSADDVVEHIRAMLERRAAQDAR